MTAPQAYLEGWTRAAELIPTLTLVDVDELARTAAEWAHLGPNPAWWQGLSAGLAAAKGTL